MKRTLLILVAAMALSLAACKPKSADAAGDAAAGDDPAAAAVSAAAADPGNAAADAAAGTPPAAAEPSEEARARAAQQAKLDYATMEDGYINDAKAQWAASAKASSTYGVEAGVEPDAEGGYVPMQATGAVNGSYWSNRSRDIGFDWLALEYAKPVHASEVRIALTQGRGVKGITKIELIDGTGQAHAVWSGLSDGKPDERGDRTWIVRKFEPTTYQAKGVKLTFANNVENDYSYVDAVQLIGN